MADSAKQLINTGDDNVIAIDGGIAVKIGLNRAEISSLLEGALGAATATQQAKIDDLDAKLNTSREAVRGFLRILKEDEVPEDQLATKLAVIAERHVDQVKRLAALGPGE